MEVQHVKFCANKDVFESDLLNSCNTVTALVVNKLLAKYFTNIIDYKLGGQRELDNWKMLNVRVPKLNMLTVLGLLKIKIRNGMATTISTTSRL